MKTQFKALLLPFLLGAAVCVSLSVAQEIDPGNLGLPGSGQDVDSYWIDQNTWLFYNFRPYVKTHMYRFTNIPSYSAGHNYYAYGTTPPTGGPGDEVEVPVMPIEKPKVLDKSKVQVTRKPLWH